MSKVNLFGLNAYGVPQGMERLWGSVAATGVGTLGAIAARRFASPGSWASRWSEAVGLLAGAGASLAMIGFESTRAAGWMGLVSTGLNNGLRILEQVMFGGQVAGLGWYTTETANPMLGMPTAHQINGVGYPVAADQPHAYGTVPGVAGPVAGPVVDQGQSPINLLNGQINLLGNGGPSISSLSSLYGSTHFSR